MENKLISFVIIASLASFSRAQSWGLAHVKTGGGQAGGNWSRSCNSLSGSSLMSQVQASSDEAYTSSSSASLSVKLVITVSFNGTADLHPSASCNYAFGRSRSASAIASNHKDGGSAKGNGMIDELSVNAMIGVGEHNPPPKTDSANVSGSAVIPFADFVWSNGVWTGTYEIKLHELSASGSLIHPDPGYKEDEGVGAAALATSNFLPSNLVINFN